MIVDAYKQISLDSENFAYVYKQIFFNRTTVAPLQRLKLEYMVLLKVYVASRKETLSIFFRQLHLRPSISVLTTHTNEVGGASGVIGAFPHIIQTEGFLSLYKGLVPSILSMHLQLCKGSLLWRIRQIKISLFKFTRRKAKNQVHESTRRRLNILEQLELRPVRTLLHGALDGACAEVATCPFEVVRRQLL
ncbi:substrate carrier protein [Artemisia annua]|uniref:Substrate carrier protein n=1 Tax=Artemisia annua TaxID=35608 RepID=A0A2U1QM83_ARTAN|nr:substrate carrier protein [Artemisia annua]